MRFITGTRNAFALPLFLIFCGYLIVNISFPNNRTPLYPYEKVEVLTSDSLLSSLYRRKIEQDFFNFYSHFCYINAHFNNPSSFEDTLGNIISRKDGEIIYYYLDLSRSSDSVLVEIGKLGHGLCLLLINDLEGCQRILLQVNSQKTKWFNYIQGLLFFNKCDYEKAIKHFERELNLSKQLDKEIFPKLVYIYTRAKNDKGLLELLNNDRSKKFVKNDKANKIYYKYHIWSKYVENHFNYFADKFTYTSFFVAFLIGIIWSIYLLKLNVFKDCKWYYFSFSLIFGMGFTFGTFFLSDYNKIVLANSLNGEYLNDLFYCVFGIGLIEESVKILPVLLLVVTNRIKEPYEYILYACASALGFAFIENLIYFDDSMGNGIIHGRALTAVVGHMVDSTFAAYGLILCKFKYKRTYVFLLFPVFLLLASISHGLYDYWLFFNLKLIFIPYFLFTTTIWIILINNSLNNSSKFNYQHKFNPDDTQLFLTTSLTLVLIVEYIIAGYKYGSSQANDSLISATFGGSIYILFFAFKFIKIDLIPNYWRPIRLNNSDLDSADSFTNILRFFASPFSANSIESLNFVGLSIIIRSSLHNKELKPFLRKQINCEIITRITLYEVKNSDNIIADPFWYLSKLESSLYLNEIICEYILIKFRDKNPSFKKQSELFVYFKAVPLSTDLENGKLMESTFPSFGWAIVTQRAD